MKKNNIHYFFLHSTKTNHICIHLVTAGTSHSALMALWASELNKCIIFIILLLQHTAKEDSAGHVI